LFKPKLTFFSELVKGFPNKGVKTISRAPAIILLIYLSLCPVQILIGQNFNLSSYTTNEGLPHNNVRAITRDSVGYLWLATWDGLSRFDGHDFKNYYHSSSDTSSIPFFSVYDLYTDRNDNLWLLTDWSQVVKYNRVSDNFTIVKSIGGAVLNHVMQMNTDQQGYLWIVTDSTLIRWDDKTRQSSIYNLFDKSGNRIIIKTWPGSVNPSGNSELWFTGYSAMKFIKAGEDRFILEAEYPVRRNLSGKIIDFDFRNYYKYYKSPSGISWIFSNLGLFRLDEKSGCFNEYHGSPPCNELAGQSTFNWGWMDDGIYTFNCSNQRLIHIPAAMSRMPGAILSDGSSSLWFSSVTASGVAQGFKHAVFTKGFFRNRLFLDKDSAAPAVYSVVMDKNRDILVGLRGYDHIIRFTPDGVWHDIDFLPDDLFRKALHVRSIQPVKNGFWIGYFSQLLQFYDNNTQQFKNFFPPANTLRAILPEKDNCVFIGTNDLLLFNASTNHTDTLWKSGTNLNIFKLFLDEEGILWGPSARGRLLRYDTASHKGSVIQLTTYKCNIEDVIPGDDGDLWLALLGEGVCRYSRTSGSFKYYTTSDGLSNNTTYNLLRDKSGYIWVSTNSGISRINPSSGKIKAFGPTDGLSISEFNSGAKFKTPDGQFIFGGMGGFVSFYPDSLKEDNLTGQKNGIILTGLEVSGSPFYPEKPLEVSDTIIFRKGDDNFHITFSDNDFINTDKIIYRYKLSGINRAWIETGARNRNINYSNLSPGWYRLTIEATDANGDWTTSRSLILRITPVFFKTLFFIILSVVLVTASIALAIYFFIRNIKEKEIRKQDELKLQSLRGQMNPHFIFNSLNSINYFISNNDRLSANRYVADFSRLIRSILANTGSNFIPLRDEMSSIEDYLRIEHLRFRDKFDYAIDITALDRINDVEVSPGIVQPFIENAIWHGVRGLEKRKGMITIKFFPGNECIRCIIEDDGIGRVASLMKRGVSDRHKSRGISLVSERLLLTGKLKRTNYRLEISDLDESKAETGTKVEVDIPANKKG
jgi:streptogramin lyase